MADALTAAYTIDTKHTVNQPAFTLGAALRTSNKTGTETGTEAGKDAGQDTGDTVIISQQGKNMAARQAQTQEAGDDTEESKEQALIRSLKERIAKVQQEIKQPQADSTLSDEEKRQQLMLKQSDLVELQTQLAKAYKELAKVGASAGQSAGMTSLGSYGARS